MPDEAFGVQRILWMGRSEEDLLSLLDGFSTGRHGFHTIKSFHLGESLYLRLAAVGDCGSVDYSSIKSEVYYLL